MSDFHIYNVVACLCSLIIRSCSEDFFVKYSCVSHGELERGLQIIKNNIPLLFDDKKIIKLKKEQIQEQLINALERLIDDLADDKDYYCLMTLATVLDEALSDMLLDEIEHFQKDSFTTVLNTNRETVGIGLLPRCSCVWERKMRLSHCYNRMDNFMYNFLIMENTILGELIDKHIFLSEDVFPNFKEKRSLKIAASPLCLERPFKFVYFSDDKVQYVSVEYFDEENESINELIWKKILVSAKKKCDIVVFPEVMGNKDTENFIINKIKALPENEQNRLPSFIVLPSFFSEKSNTVTVIDKWGRIIAKQKKQNPFREIIGSNSYLEQITPPLVVNIFHYEGIGRIAVLICKDFLTTKYLEQLMRCFKLTLIIVPSFSTGSYDFVQSFDICAHDDCNVVWINTCAALEPGKEENFEHIGYVRKRIGKYDDKNQKLCEMSSCPGFKDKKCNRDCLFFEKITEV